jgi:hypothetical protein
LAFLGRLSWERVDGFVMQASEKPAQERKCKRPVVRMARLRVIFQVSTRRQCHGTQSADGARPSQETGFRDQVSALLRAGGFTAETEILEGHERVDIVFVQTTFGKRRRYVVEAKNWPAPLNKTDLESIYGSDAASDRRLDRGIRLQRAVVLSTTAAC